MANNAILTIRRELKRPSRDIVDQFAGVPTPNIGDAQGREGAIDYRIKPIFSPFSPFAGPAVTVSVLERDNLAAHAVMAFLKPGDVLVIETRDDVGGAVFGDLMLGMYKNCGVAAVITDGLVRDAAEITRRGVPVFARGLSPKGPHKNGPGTIGMDVSIGGVVIRTGDIVVGDTDGAIVVPQDRFEATLEAMKTVREKEESMLASVNSGLQIMPFAKDFLAGDGVQFVD